MVRSVFLLRHAWCVCFAGGLSTYERGYCQSDQDIQQSSESVTRYSGLYNTCSFFFLHVLQVTLVPCFHSGLTSIVDIVGIACWFVELERVDVQGSVGAGGRVIFSFFLHPSLWITKLFMWTIKVAFIRWGRLLRGRRLFIIEEVNDLDGDDDCGDGDDLLPYVRDLDGDKYSYKECKIKSCKLSKGENSLLFRWKYDDEDFLEREKFVMTIEDGTVPKEKWQFFLVLVVFSCCCCLMDV